MTKKIYVLFFIFLFPLKSYSQACACTTINPCVDGTSWYPDPPDLVSETFNYFMDTSDFSGHQIGLIEDIPYVYYGANKIKYFYNNSLDDAGHKHYMDIYFPVQFIHQCENHGYTYPVLIYLPGGGFASSSRRSSASDCEKFAEKGFIVVNLDYRTARHVQCDDANNNYILVRALQDERLAMRTVEAISLKYYYLINAKGKYLYLPFIDVNRIFLGGSSAGAVTSVTASYYDACDVDSAMDRNEELSGKHLGKAGTSTYTIICNDKNKSVPFQLDQDTCKTGADSVIYYFDPSVIPSAPMNRILGVISLKGGVPEDGNDYEITQNPGIKGSGATGRPFDPNDGSTYPKFVANASDHSDYIPMIAFHGVNDNLVPFSNNFEPIYIIDDPGNNCTGQYNDIEYDYCWDDEYDNCGSTGHQHVPKNGFLFGSKKIYDALNHRGVKAQLFARPGETHSAFEADKWSFITAQSALFANAVLCNTALSTNFDSVMNYKVWTGSIGFDDCDAKNVSIHFTLENKNKTAVITKVDVIPRIYRNDTIITSLSLPVTLEYAGPSSVNYINPNDSGQFIISGIPLRSGYSITGSIKITLVIQNVNGFDDSAFGSIGNSKPDSIVRSRVGVGCYNRLEGKSPLPPNMIFPNPSSNDFTVSFDENCEFAQVYTIAGVQLETIFKKDQPVTFGKDYNSGIYLVIFQFKNGRRELLKAIKE